jgi:heme exporter protein B
MGRRPSGSAAAAAALIAKDIRSEFRTRYALNALVMFSLVTLTVVGMAIGKYNMADEIAAAFYWVVVFFSAAAGLGHTFIKEEETGTMMSLRVYTGPLTVFFGKLIFNCLLLLILDLMITPLFIVFMGIECGNIGLFLVVIILGSTGLSAATTIIAAIVAKASARGSLLAILSFPILLPLLLSAIGGTMIAFSGGGFYDALPELKLLIAYTVIVVIASTFLFEFIWNE